ncbi:MAG: glycosyltransferase family 4 protein [Myxococcales bacterium]|nr:glycosyltransferase family 4 protein [Myxococcales bacterium]
MTTKRHILYLHQSADLYGSDVMLRELVRELDRDRFRVTVLLPRTGPLVDLLMQDHIDVRIEPMAVVARRDIQPASLPSLGRRMLGRHRSLKATIVRIGPDLVHTNTVAALGPAMAAASSRAPHVWHVHEIVESPRTAALVLPWLTHLASTRVVCNSRATADALRRFCPPLAAKTSVVLNGIDSRRFAEAEATDIRRACDWPQDAFVFLLPGRVHWWKGQDVFVSAAKLVSERWSQARFLIVGDAAPGHQRQVERLERQIDEMKLRGRVTRWSHHHTIERVMKASDVVVNPSTQPEPFGLVVVEAMAVGKPVIASAAGGPLEIVDDGVTGRLVRPTDERALADAMLEFRSGDLARSMGQHGQRKQRQIFTIQRHAREMEKVYEGLLTGGFG